MTDAPRVTEFDPQQEQEDHDEIFIDAVHEIFEILGVQPNPEQLEKVITVLVRFEDIVSLVAAYKAKHDMNFMPR